MTGSRCFNGKLCRNGECSEEDRTFNALWRLGECNPSASPTYTYNYDNDTRFDEIRTQTLQTKFECLDQCLYHEETLIACEWNTETRQCAAYHNPINFNPQETSKILCHIK